MKIKLFQWLGIVLILITGIIHFLLAPVEYEEVHYVGILFSLNFMAAIIAALGILRGKFWGWALGAMVAGGSIIGYLWSRTTGMPGMGVEEWFTQYGVVALLAEATFITLVFFRPWRQETAQAGEARSAWLRFGLPVTAMLMMAAIIASAYLWNAASGEAGHGAHKEASVEELDKTPPTSLSALEQQYGVHVSLVAVTAMNSIVDVRLQIIDSAKARQLLSQHPSILINNETLILAANMHRHNFVNGKTYVIYYPNLRSTVSEGSPVSLVFGNMRVEPVTAQ